MNVTRSNTIRAAKIVGAVLIATYATLTSTGCMKTNVPTAPVGPPPGTVMPETPGVS